MLSLFSRVQTLCLIFVLGLFLSCGHKEEAKTSTLITFQTKGLLPAMNGGVVIYGQSRTSSDAFAFTFNDESASVSIQLNNGSWNFAAIGWAGPNKMEGAHKCAFTMKEITGSNMNITLSLNTASCGSPVFGDPSFTVGVNQFQPLKVHTCLALGGVNPTSVTGECDAQLRGEGRSFQLILTSAKFFNGSYQAVAQNLTSNCQSIAAYPSSFLVTPLVVPIGNNGLDGVSPLMIFRMYNSNGCTGDSTDIYFPDGLIGGNPSPFTGALVDDNASMQTNVFLRNSILDYDWYNEKGYSVHSGGFGNDTMEDIDYDDDGDIYVAGTVKITGPENRFAIWKYQPDGTLDSTFNGSVNPYIDSLGASGLTDSEAKSIVIDPDGKILVAGTANGTYANFIARFNSDGSLDTTFGTLGYVINPNGAYNVFEDMLVEETGGSTYTIHLAGTKYGGGTNDVLYAAYTHTGTASFSQTYDGGGGIADYEEGISINIDGTYAYIAGSGKATGPQDNMVVWKFNQSTGAYVTAWSFGEVGYAGEQPNGNQLGRDSIFATDGDLLVAGFTTMTSPNQPKAVVWKLDTSTGALDTSFGASGVTPLDNFCSSFHASDGQIAYVLDYDEYDRILVGGACGDNAGTWNASKAFMKRFTNDGQIDTTFAEGGSHLFPTVVPRAANENGATEIYSLMFFYDGSVFMTGYQTSDSDGKDAFLMKVYPPSYL